MSNYKEKMILLADAIRSKSNISNKLTIENMISAVNSISNNTNNTNTQFITVKVTKYSPYVPAYPAQIGYNISALSMQDMAVGEEISQDRIAPYLGLYVLTEETKGYTKFGRIYKNQNGMYISGWDSMTWTQATEDSDPEYCQWMVTSSPTDQYSCMLMSSTGLTDPPTTQDQWMSAPTALRPTTITMTTEQTAPPTDEIPMVLKGNKASDYVDGQWDIDSEQNTLSGFDFEPLLDWIYFSKKNSLIGSAIGSNVPASLDVPLHANVSTAETGQTLTINPDAPSIDFKVISGVSCVNFERVGYIRATPIDFLRENGDGFAVSFMLRRDRENGDSRYLFTAYDGPWSDSQSIGLRLIMEYGRQLLITGGSPDRNRLNSYDSQIDTWSFKTFRWYHLCFIFYADHEEVYVDGKQIWYKKIARKFKIRQQDTYNFATIGNEARSAGANWDGSMAEFKYYSNVISPAQVKAEADRCLALVTE